MIQDLQQLGDLQRAAAASGGSGGGVTWQQYEQHAKQQLAKLEAELPMASIEAAQLQVGRMPLLCSGFFVQVIRSRYCVL